MKRFEVVSVPDLVGGVQSSEHGRRGGVGQGWGGTASGLHPGVGHNSELSGPGVRGDGLGAWFRGAGGREHLRVTTSNLTRLWASTQTTLFQHHTPVLHASWVKHT